jgi:hypothetical protein
VIDYFGDAVAPLGYALVRFLADMTTKLVPGVRLHWVVESLAASLATEMDFQARIACFAFWLVYMNGSL